MEKKTYILFLKKKKKKMIALFWKIKCFENCFYQRTWYSWDYIKQHFVTKKSHWRLLIKTCQIAKCADFMRDSERKWKSKLIRNWTLQIMAAAVISWNISKTDLSFKRICRKATAVDGDCIENWKNSVLKDIWFRFDESNAFNLEEKRLILLCFAW